MNWGVWARRSSKVLALARGRGQWLAVMVDHELSIKLPRSAHKKFWGGPHEDSVLFKFLAQNLEPGQIFIDVGANIGIYSVVIARRTGARVVAFEPIPATAMVLRDVLQLNKVDDATVENFALSDRPDFVRMSGFENGASNFQISSSNPDISMIEVPARTLDDWCLETGQIPRAIKIDVEGQELAVLRGGAGILRKYRPVLLIECHCGSWEQLGVRPVEFADLLSGFGYSTVTDPAGNVINLSVQHQTTHLCCSA